MSSTTLNPAHLATSSAKVNSAEQTQDANGLERRMPVLSRTVQRLKTPIPQQSAKATQSGKVANFAVQTVKEVSAADQVDASELASAVSLRGTSDKRNIESRKNNIRFFKALTNGQQDFMDMHVRSIISSVADKTALKSLVDLTFPRESGKQRALFKFILLEIALSSPEEYGLSPTQTEALMKTRNNLYELHGEYIEQSKLAIDLAQATAPKMNIGLKQTIKAFQMLPDAEQQVGGGILEILKVVMNSPNQNAVNVLKGMRSHWLNLIKRDRNQYSSDVVKYRQFILTAKVKQIEATLTVIGGLDKIAALCKKVLNMEPNNMGVRFEQQNT